MDVFVRLNGRGQTILMVTHEHDIAGYAGRQLHLLDGIVERDVVSEGRAGRRSPRLRSPVYARGTEDVAVPGGRPAETA